MRYVQHVNLFMHQKTNKLIYSINGILRTGFIIERGTHRTSIYFDQVVVQI